MKNRYKILLHILSMIIGAAAGCALDVSASRPGENLTVHVSPASQPTAVRTN